MLTDQLIRRFLAKVDLRDQDGHHKWLGAYSEKRHFPPRPVFWIANLYENGKRVGQIIVPAARVALAIYDGVPLGERSNLYACHKAECADPSCVSPLHLYWGTAEENRWDRYGSNANPRYFLERMHKES